MKRSRPRRSTGGKPRAARSPLSADLLRTVLAHSADVIALVDRDGTILYSTAGTSRPLDFSSEELLGHNAFELVHPDDQVHARRLLASLLERPDVAVTADVRGRRRDGSYRTLELVALNRLADPKTKAIVVTYRDVSDRRHLETLHKTAEDALREREALYRALFENAPIGLGIADETGKLLAFNDAMRAPGGYSAQDIEALGNVALLYCYEDERQQALDLARRNGYLHRHEVHFRRKDGSCYDALMSLTPVEVSGRRCWLALVEDLTEQRRAEAARHTAEERYRSFIEHSTEAIYRFEVDPSLPVALSEDQQIEHWYRHAYLAECNDAMARIYGYGSAAELLGARLGDLLVRTNPSNEEMLRAFIRGGYRVTDMETNERDRDGRPKVFVNALIGLIENGHLKRAWGTQRDVSERRELEAQLRQAQKMEAIGRLAGGVAHDFNNLLTAMLGSVELLLASLSPADPRLEDATDIKAAASRAAALTRQLLAFSRRQLLRPETLDLNRVVREVQRLLRRLIAEDIELVTLLGPDVGAVKADRGQVEQAIVSLVVNARDAMPHGGTVTLETGNRILDDAFVRRHPGAAMGPHVMLAVHDTGEGIEPEIQGLIFEPFFTTKEVGKGTGLGLATVYGIVKQSGGHITVDSARGRGTTFSIYLPLVPALPEVERAKAAVEPATGMGELSGAPEPDLKGGNEAILVVEDEERIRATARRILEHYGYRVLLAADGQAALELLTAEGAQVDLVLSDVVMPRLNGQQLYEAVRELGMSTKFLFTSGYVGRESRTKMVLDPTVPFLPKPWTVQDLITRVRSILDEQATAAT